MASGATALGDGGRVESWVSDGVLHLQKYDVAGKAVGAEFVSGFHGNQAPQVVALAGGGYAAMMGFTFRGAENPLYVFDAAGAQVASLEAAGSGIGATLAASPAGGFLVVSMEAQFGPGGVDYGWRPLLTLYDNSGVAVRGPVGLSGDLPQVTVGADGHYRLAWQDGALTHSLDIDPAHPADLARPAAPAFTLVDDEGPYGGMIAGPTTTDPTPVVRVAVHETGAVLVNREASGAPEHTLDGGVAVTAADVARGYVDVHVGEAADAGMGLTFYVHFKSAEGVVGEAGVRSVTVVAAPEADAGDLAALGAPAWAVDAGVETATYDPSEPLWRFMTATLDDVAGGKAGGWILG